MTDPTDDPLAPARGLGVDGLLALLEQLEGAEEAAVVRSALAPGAVDEPAALGERAVLGGDVCDGAHHSCSS